MEWQRESWEDVTISLEEISFNDETSLIGTGRFGEVHRGYFHQDVAVKLLNMDHVGRNEKEETFREEVLLHEINKHSVKISIILV